jgi:hypothetical protein
VTNWREKITDCGVIKIIRYTFFSLGPGVDCKAYRKQIAENNILAAIAEKEDKRKNAEVNFCASYAMPTNQSYGKGNFHMYPSLTSPARGMVAPPLQPQPSSPSTLTLALTLC